MKYQIKHFWLKVVIAGVVIGVAGIVQFQFLDLIIQYPWLSLVELLIFSIAYALLFQRATFIGTVYSSIISSSISTTYLLLNWDGYLEFVKSAIDDSIANDPNVKAVYDARPQLYESQINPSQFGYLGQVLAGILITALIALFIAWLLGKFKRKTEIIIPENLIAEDGTLLVDNLIPPPVPASETPVENKPEEK